MQNSFKSLIDGAKSILVLLPKGANFDEVAAGLSLYLSLSGKKETTIGASDPIVVEFNRLIGVNKIQTELGNKNLAIALTGYDPSQVEQVSYDIEENKELRLNIITKIGANPPTREQVQIIYTGIRADLIILVGGKGSGDFPALKMPDLANVRTAHVGTSEVRIDGREIISLDRPASSISEVAASLIREGDKNVNSDIATNLLMGVEEGSKSFTTSEVNADTFLLISELMKLGGKRVSQQGRVDAQDFPQGAIPGQQPAPAPAQGAPASWMEPKIFKGTSVS